MNGHAMKRLGTLVLAFCLLNGLSVTASEKKEKDGGKTKDADYSKATPELKAREKKERNIAAEIESEVNSRRITLPAGMDLDVEWYSPHVSEETGKLIKGWAIEDVVLLETDKHNLICVRRADGVERWRCELNAEIRYTPAVSRNNVVVNVNNYLVGIEKNAGYVRWKLLPSFVMSCSPLVVDPAAYPREYTRQWKNLESIYVGGWDGRFYSMLVRGRMGYIVKKLDNDNFSAPEFDLYYAWHKTHRNRGVVSANIVLKENILYYIADDQNCYAVTREGEEREPYYMLGTPSTNVAVTSPTSANATISVLSNVYVGASDNNLYCLDRLTLRKKWVFPSGYMPIGDIVADEAATPYVYARTNNGILHALQIQPSTRAQKNAAEIPESYSEAWTIKTAGVIALGPDIVYVGSAAAKDAPGYTSIEALNKSTGKVLWKVDGGIFAQYLPFTTNWSVPGQETRLYAITADNRLVSLRESDRDTGIKVVKMPAEAEMPKVIIGKKAPGAGAGADAPKADAPKADAPKPEEKKAAEPKPEEKKPEPKAEAKPEAGQMQPAKADEKKPEDNK